MENGIGSLRYTRILQSLYQAIIINSIIKLYQAMLLTTYFLDKLRRLSRGNSQSSGFKIQSKCFTTLSMSSQRFQSLYEVTNPFCNNFSDDDCADD